MPTKVLIDGQECPVINSTTFNGVLHYGIIFVMKRDHWKQGQGDIVIKESIGWVPASLVLEVK